MSIRGDSYGTIAEVLAYTRHLMDGQSTFNSTTRPTITEVEKFVDRASGVLNGALNTRGLTTPVTNTTAKLALDDWVVSRATEYVELTQRGAGFSGEEGSRTVMFANMSVDALAFVKSNELGWKRLGVAEGHRLSEGLAFTGQTIQADRADPDDTTLEQPKFLRGQWDNP